MSKRGCLTLPLSQSFSLPLRLRGDASQLALVGSHLARLDDGAPRGLPCEDSRVVDGRACPKMGDCGLPRFRSSLKTVNELIRFELTHVQSLCAPRLSAGGEKKMKPPQMERLRGVLQTRQT